jgi:hypothetical protein
VHFDPNSTTDTIKLNERDVTYSVYRPDLAALGAIDGRPGSGRPQDNDDALSRRDMGLEFLDVTAHVNIARIDSNRRRGGRDDNDDDDGRDGRGRQQEDVYRITNSSSSVVDTHLLIVVHGLSDRIRLENASGFTSAGDPYLRVFLRDGVLLPGHNIVTKLDFRRQSHAPRVHYTLQLLTGQGDP